MERILVSTFHALLGQEEGWLAMFDKALPVLTDLYDLVLVSATQVTGDTRVSRDNRSKSIVDYLREKGVRCVTSNVGIGENHRIALDLGINCLPNQASKARIHYCDFDRVLVWTIQHLDELEQIMHDAEKSEALLPYRLGIRENPTLNTVYDPLSSWASHPIVQKATEKVICDGIYSIIKYLSKGQLSPDYYFDPVGTSMIFSKRMATVVKSQSQYEGFPQTEWLAILVGESLKRGDDLMNLLNCKGVNGLVFETLEIHRYLSSDSYPVVFQRLFSQMERSQVEARKRILIAKSILQSFAHTLGRYNLADDAIKLFTLKLLEALDGLLSQVETKEDGEYIQQILVDFYLMWPDKHAKLTHSFL